MKTKTITSKEVSREISLGKRQSIKIKGKETRTIESRNYIF